MRWQSTVASALLMGAGLLAGVDAKAQQAGVAPVKPEPVQPVQAPLSDEARGDIFMARKMYREAAEVYSGIKPQTAIHLNKTGIAYHQMGDLDMAKRYYERSIRLNKKYAEALNNLGAVWYAKKSYRRATSFYQKALVLHPKSASMHSNLGTAYFARKKYEDANKEYEIAVQLDPDVFEHRSTQGVLLQERTVEERAKFNFYLAKTYSKAGMADRALLCIRKALEFGFKDKSKFMDDDDFKPIRELPEFAELMKLEPRVL
jgi:tetratricopeptide (TPR) repeat protein